jgi:6-pyruvoyltetrahydropterin/6-carboxytetrahydropterin synthase
MMKIYKDATFDAAHFLPYVDADHKCKRLHGHTYRLRVWCSGPITERGWVVDYGDIATAVRTVLDWLDHRLLNEVQDLENPTTENLAIWIFARLKPLLPQLTGIEIAESATTGCVFEPEVNG